LQSKASFMIEQPFAAWTVQSSKVAKFWWLYHFCQLVQLLIPVQNNVKLFFGKTGTPKFARSIPQIRPIPRIPICHWWCYFQLKTFQEKLFNFDLLFKIGISRYSSSCSPTKANWFPQCQYHQAPKYRTLA